MPSNNKYLLFVLIFSISIISLPSQFSFGDAGTISVDSFDVDYNIENGILDTIFLDSDFVEIILTMDTSSDGTVEITIPRSLLDAKFDTLDDEFFVLVDGFETDYAEINSTSEYRTLVIPFFGGDSVIDIIGTDALNPFTPEPEIPSFDGDSVIDIIGTDALNPFTPEPEIPSWIKNNAGWWADDQIDDTAFIQGIQYLITEGIMDIPQAESGESSGNEIPSWIKNNAGWWADGQLDDIAFVQGIQYLIQEGIMVI